MATLRSKNTFVSALRTAAAIGLMLAAALSADWAHAAEPSSQSLHGGWQFRLVPGDPEAAAHAAATDWRKAQVPGHVHTDLFAAGLIADPYPLQAARASAACNGSAWRSGNTAPASTSIAPR